jgi:hypothetical protein
MKHNNSNNNNNNSSNNNNKQPQEQQPHHSLHQQTKKSIDLLSFEENHTGKNPSDYTDLPDAKSDISV